MKKNIVFCVDQRYVTQVLVAIKSLIANNDNMDIYIVNTDLPFEFFFKFKEELSGTNIRVIDWKISEDELKWDASFEYITKISYARLLLPDLLPDLNRVLYLDCDIIVTENIDELFTVELLDSGIGMTIDWLNYRTLVNRYNSGVMLIDCEIWRKNGYVEGLKAEVEKRIETDMKADDQHVINGYFDYEGIYELPIEYNAQHGTTVLAVPQSYFDRFGEYAGGKIIHFTGPAKPWGDWGVIRGRRQWWEFNFMSIGQALQKNKEKQSKQQFLVYTRTENLRGILELSKAFPKVSFIVVAPTIASFKVIRLGAQTNIFVKELFKKEFYNYDDIKAVLMIGEYDDVKEDSQFYNKLNIPVLTYKDLAFDGVDYAYEAENVEDMVNEVQKHLN